jgi:hypothetical protein
VWRREYECSVWSGEVILGKEKREALIIRVDEHLEV